jgi:serine/threonine protein kinase
MDRSHNTSRYGSREEAIAVCLGHPGHVVQAEEVICHICGTLVAGAHLGIYQIQQLLGQGRSGSAYLATHLRSRQPVAIKLFPTYNAGYRLWEAMRKEVRVVTSLRHNAILPVFSCTLWHPETRQGSRPLPDLVATPGKEEYLLTLCQYVPGNLTSFLAYYEQSEHRVTTEQIPAFIARLTNIIKLVGGALSAAHERGIIHGALVPGNILLDKYNRPWVADFGLARLHPPSAPYLAPELIPVGQASIRTGNLELYWEAVTPFSDQYALAILCEQLLTRLLRPVDYEPVLSVLQCATSQKPSRRFASIDIFIHELIGQLTRGRSSSTSTWEGKSTTSNTEPIRPAPSTNADWRKQTGVPDVAPVSSGTEWKTTYPQLTPREKQRYEQMMNYQLSASGLPPAEDWEKRGDKLFTLHDYEGAAEAYQRALEIDNGKATTWLALGDAYLAMEKHAEALRAYEYAMQLDPNDPLAWSNRGTALDALGRHKEAMECYERASELR